MKKKELFLIVGLILFGFIFQYFDSGKITFLENCNSSNISISDKNHPHEFTKNFTYEHPLKSIRIDNQAGGIKIFPSSDNKTSVQSVKIVYHADSSKVKKYKESVMIKSKISDNKVVLRSKSSKDDFPYKRVRTFFTVYVTANTKIEIKNRLGNINIENINGSVRINEKFGDIKINNVNSDISIINKFGNTEIKKISGKTELDLEFSKAEIEEINSLDCKISHSSLYLSDIGRSDSINIKGAHTRLILKNVNSDQIKIKDSHNKIEISKVNTREFIVSSRHCKIKAYKLNSDSISIKNSFNRIKLVDVSGKKLNILLSHGDLYASFVSMFDNIFITNSFSDIHLKIPSGKDPTLSMNTKYGIIKNETGLEIVSTKNKHLTTFSKKGTDFEININTSYGDITLSEQN